MQHLSEGQHIQTPLSQNQVNCQIKSIVETLKNQVKIRPLKIRKPEPAFQSYLTQLAEADSNCHSNNQTPIPQLQESQNTLTKAEDELFFTKINSAQTPSRMMNRQKIKREIRHNRTMVKKKFDKTYKQLSLQLNNLEMSSMDDGAQSVQLQQMGSTRLANDSSPQPLDLSRHSSELGRVARNANKPYSAKLTLNHASTRASSKFAWQGLNQTTMNMMQLSNKSLSEMNSLQGERKSRIATSQSALSNSNYCLRQMKIKNDVIQRVLKNKLNAESADISTVDIDVKNKSMVLASSKPTPSKIVRDASGNELIAKEVGNNVSSPSMRAYKTNAWQLGISSQHSIM